jgi:pyocin large subunit-like protein
MRTARVLLGIFLAALLLIAGGPGFRSRRTFDEHYAKHGREFGNISQAEYLQRAQALRDAPVGGPILEAVKPGGVFTRFDRRSSAFGAYNSDRTIRTFFIPNDGERYFHRQANRPDE